MHEVYLTRTQAAKILGVHPATLGNWAVWKQGPSLTRDGRRVLYRTADVLAFAAERRARRG